LNPDLTVNNVNYTSTYNFTRWYDCVAPNLATATGTPCAQVNPAASYNAQPLFAATNTFTVTAAGAETVSNYYKIRKFDNGTVWWSMYVCTTNGVVGAGQIDCSAATGSNLSPLAKATQIAWYETLLAGTPGQMRTVYYVNGTVSQETWTWDATLGRVQTVTKVIIA
jgi:hypothetical protein